MAASRFLNGRLTDTVQNVVSRSGLKQSLMDMRATPHFAKSERKFVKSVRFQALACDYDGTLALNGAVAETTLKALNRFRNSGRKLVLVTGRELGELIRIFPYTGLFEQVVAENGAVLHAPSTSESLQLAQGPPTDFVQQLLKRGVKPPHVGRVIIATREPNETTTLAVIRELGLELQVIFNKGAVMVLPSTVNKATGLKAALKKLGVLPTAVVGIGDAENDHSFLNFCGLSVAVANAVAALKEEVDLVTLGADGAGVEELINNLLKEDTA